MKFHLVVSGLFFGVIGLLYFIFTGIQSDFDRARPQIHKEAVETVKKKRREVLAEMKREAPVQDKKIETTVFNPALFKAPIQVAEAVEAKEASVMIERIGNDEYWCRDGDSPRKEANPVKCYYSAACYGCAGSTVIPPDSANVIPFCDNGQRAEIFSIECCPHAGSDGSIECPSARECLHADPVPETACSCNNRPDCRYVSIGTQIQCVCIQ